MACDLHSYLLLGTWFAVCLISFAITFTPAQWWANQLSKFPSAATYLLIMRILRALIALMFALGIGAVMMRCYF